MTEDAKNEGNKPDAKAEWKRPTGVEGILDNAMDRMQYDLGPMTRELNAATAALMTSQIQPLPTATTEAFKKIVESKSIKPGSKDLGKSDKGITD